MKITKENLIRTGWVLSDQSTGGIEWWIQAKDLLIYNSYEEEVVGVFANICF